MPGHVYRHEVIGDQKTVLADQLSASQDQVRTLQAELAVYQQLLNEAKAASSSRVAGTSTGAEGGGAGSREAGTSAEEGSGKLLDERTLRLLEEVAGLRETLDSSIQNSNTLAEQLRGRLGHTYADHTSMEGDGVLDASRAHKATGTREKGSGSGHTHQRSVQTQYTVRANMTSAGFQTNPRGGH